MRGHPLAIVGIASLFACALIAAGCGGDDSTLVVDVDVHIHIRRRQRDAVGRRRRQVLHR